MRSTRGWASAIVVLGLCGCGPEVNDDDSFPNNCGIEGPVDLFGVFPNGYLEVQRAGEYYLVDHSWDAEHIETYSVDRCGHERVELQRVIAGDPLRIGSGGDHALRCNEDTGELDYIDPTGVEPPRPLFPGPVEACRVVPLDQGLAAQQRESGTVWFHPDPADPSAEAIVVTDEARVADPDWLLCWPEFDCESYHPFGVDITAAGDELLVMLESEAVLAFSSSTYASRIFDEGPVQAMDVLPGDDLVVVKRHLGSHLVVERETGAALEFCCYDDIEPIHRFGDWLLKGSVQSPFLPEPPEWTNFRALHLPSGNRTEVSGTEAWRVVAPLTADTIVVDNYPVGDSENRVRHVVWPATGERRPAELPGELVWAIPGTDGVFSTEDDLDPHGLHHLAGPDQSPRTLLRDVTLAFPTVHGRIVFEDGRREEYLDPLPLAVMLPDEQIVQLDEHVRWTMSDYPWSERWVADSDEVVYLAENEEGHWMLKRTVLP